MKKISKIRMYVEIPSLQAVWKKPPKTSYLLGLGFSWWKGEYSIYNVSGIYPKGEKKGKHIFTLSLYIGYFSLKFVFYEPKDKLSWETETNKKE